MTFELPFGIILHTFGMPFAGIEFSLLYAFFMYFLVPRTSFSIVKTIVSCISALFEHNVKIMNFGINFYTILAPMWHHLGGQVGTILASKIAQVGAQDAQGSQNPPRPPPGLDFDRILMDC